MSEFGLGGGSSNSKKHENGSLDKHDRRVLLRITRRFTSGCLSIEFFIGRKRHRVNLDKEIWS